jgi:hypothetical protein
MHPPATSLCCSTLRLLYLFLLWVCAPATFGNRGVSGVLRISASLVFVAFGPVLIARTNLSPTQNAMKGRIPVVVLWNLAQFCDQNVGTWA